MVIVELRTTGVRRTQKGLRQMSINLRGGFAKIVAQKGYKLARQIAPRARDSQGGGTRAALQLITTKQTGKVVLRQPTKRGGNRPYHLWMHGRGGKNIARHIYTGDPHFMDTTRDFMQKLVKKEIKKRMKSKRL